MTTIRKPFFVLPLDFDYIASGNAVPGNPVFHLRRFKAPGLTWKTDGASNVWAHGTFIGGEKPVDFCALVSANALPGTTIRLRLGASEAEVGGGSATYDSGAMPFISPSISREDGLYHSHLELDTPVDASWWRVDIGGHTGNFEAAHLVLGEKIQPGRFYNYDFEYGVEDLGSLEFSRWGIADEEPGLILRTADFTLAWNTEAELEASFRPMAEKLGKRGVVFCAFDPEPTAYRQARTYLGVLKKPLAAKRWPAGIGGMERHFRCSICGRRPVRVGPMER